MGSQYVVTLGAVNAATGDTLAEVQARANSKEQVLKSLDQAATQLREKLGESLVSIKRFDKPLGGSDHVVVGSAQGVRLG